MKQERITVIGGSGFLGRYIVELLADQGAVVKVAVRDIEKAKFLKPLGQVGQVTPIRINIFDSDIEKLEQFNLTTQSSIGPIERFVISPFNEFVFIKIRKIKLITWFRFVYCIFTSC